MGITVIFRNDDMEVFSTVAGVLPIAESIRNIMPALGRLVDFENLSEYFKTFKEEPPDRYRRKSSRFIFRRLSMNYTCDRPVRHLFGTYPKKQETIVVLKNHTKAQ